MNNLTTIRDFFQLSLSDVATKLDLTTAELTAIENGEVQPAPLMWQRLAEFYADQFHVPALPEQTEPIHFRLSVDYLMNIGLTMNDLLALKWYFNNTRPELGLFAMALFSQDEARIIERLTDELPEILDQYAGYILLNHDGTLNAFIDERNDNKVSDWRLVLYKRDGLLVDITDQLIYFDDLINYSLI
ncbi:MAG: helix-turn-helix transcriptional regulator [Lactobacillaceae bacterium]|nr:helix-turn-helix transcriptional regulator [Lactobacillaceae bacterium]